MSKHIPFNRSTLLGNELHYIEEAVRSGVISGEGVFSKRCAAMLAELMQNSPEVLLTPSCTDALEMCALLTGVGPEDEVLLPSFTFVSTATAFALRGAQLRFADIDPETLNIDPDDVESRITDRTKAVVVVHYAGRACNMDALERLAQKNDLILIEDAAHALGGLYRGRPLGSIAPLATFSFHETKNITCGEGGALVVNDPSMRERAVIIRDKGTNRRAFMDGLVAKYSWVDDGSSFIMSDVLSAFLYGQLEHLQDVTTRRRQLSALYAEGLQDLKRAGRLFFPEDCEPESQASGHAFFILLEDEANRESLRKYLNERGVNAVFHYQPLHNSAYAKKRYGEHPPLPITESAAKRLLRLPLYYSLSEADVDRAVHVIHSFFNL